jgi:hypothetical protein
LFKRLFKRGRACSRQAAKRARGLYQTSSWHRRRKAATRDCCGSRDCSIGETIRDAVPLRRCAAQRNAVAFNEFDKTKQKEEAR